jgi:hypothetical protein
MQIVIPGSIGAYLVLMMGMGMSEGSGREGVLAVIVGGGAVIGLLVWLLGLIAAPASRIRLVWTAALSMLGLAVSYSLIEATLRAGESPLGSLLFFGALAAPLAGAMAGYYWLGRSSAVQRPTAP